MTVHIGLLRAVNLAGYNKVSMADLRELLDGLGMQDTRSLLQSGNIVFRSRVASAPRLERLLEDGAEKRLGLKTDFLIRSASEWSALITDNPFPNEARSDPSRLLVMFLRDAPSGESVTALQKAISGRERVRAKGRQAYIVYPDGMGRSRLTTALIERKLSTRGTGRNWNTVRKLEALAQSL